MKPDGVWLTDDTLLDVPPAQRAKWLKTEIGLSTAVAKRVASAYNKAAPQSERIEALQTQRYKRTAPAAAGRYVLQPGSERRRTSSHYTPRSLTSRMVQRAFEPVFLAMGEQRTASALLALKVCDPAMGSGAFLVEACRALADEVVAAWTREGTLAEIAATHGDPVVHARRLVAQRCLYGVDKNPFAVDLAKLSLWLVTLAADEPFTFVDHALRHGDSLVGLDLDQIRSLSWKPTQQQVLVQRALDDAVSLAVGLRREILALAESGDPRDVQRKTHLLHDADDALRRARLIADLVVAAFFSGGSAKERKALLTARQDAIVAWLSADTAAPAALLLARETLRAEVPAFHWMLEFPEVFSGERPDPLAGGQEGAAAWFDVFVGNPPFLGGRRIREEVGDAYTEWLEAVDGGSKNADLCARFFNRCAHYVGEHGTMGLIATNTISQGDTRATGLQRIVGRGAKIYDAVESMPWPGEAGVTISTLHLALGSCATLSLAVRLDGVAAKDVNSRLRPKPERPDPVRLRANTHLSFVGSYVLGMGFTLSPEERDALTAKDPRNGERIFPYLGGAEVNRSPTHDFNRYVINFGDMSLEEAEAWPDLIERVRRLVKPERDRVRRKPHREKWWQYGDRRPALYRAIAPLDRCLVNSQVSKHCVFAHQPTDRVFSHTLNVFAAPRYEFFGALQSRPHGA